MPKATGLQLLPCFLGLSLASFPLLAMPISPTLANTPTPPTVPDNLKVPQGEVLVLKAQAKGVQIYQCQAKADNSSQFEWTLKAPEAALLDDKAENIGKHYAGPTWEANDGSKVVGQVTERANSADRNAIPWLLLTAKSHEGNGIFSRVTSIQRVNTVGGKPPSTGCDSSHQGDQVRVNYEADYYFFRAASPNG